MCFGGTGGTGGAGGWARVGAIAAAAVLVFALASPAAGASATGASVTGPVYRGQRDQWGPNRASGPHRGRPDADRSATGRPATDLIGELTRTHPIRTHPPAASARPAKRSAGRRCSVAGWSSRRARRPCRAGSRPRPGCWSISTPATILAAQDPHGRYQPASILKILTVDTLLAEAAGQPHRHRERRRRRHRGLAGRPDRRRHVHHRPALLRPAAGVGQRHRDGPGRGRRRGGEDGRRDERRRRSRSGAYDTFVADPVGPGRVAAAHQRLRHGAVPAGRGERQPFRRLRPAARRACCPRST